MLTRISRSKRSMNSPKKTVEPPAPTLVRSLDAVKIGAHATRHAARASVPYPSNVVKNKQFVKQPEGPPALHTSSFVECCENWCLYNEGR